MTRNASGNYSLPSGNPVVAGTTITATWANTTMSDLGTEMTDSLSRSGKGAMLSVLKITDGTVGNPSLAFNTDVDNGIYLESANKWHLVAGGASIMTIDAASKTASKSAGYTAVFADRGHLIVGTADLTLALTAAATLTDGWYINIKADGGDITVDPDGAETIDGAATFVFVDGESGAIYCDGTGFYTITGVATGGKFKGSGSEKGPQNAADIFRCHAQTLDSDTTIDADENAIAAGDLTISSGVTLTVTAGGSLVIV